MDDANIDTNTPTANTDSSRVDNPSNADVVLTKCADEIRRLEKATEDTVVGNAIKIGCQLTTAKDAAGHENWSPWLKREFPRYTDRHALNFMHLYELSLSNPKSISDLKGSVNVTGLFLLAAPSTSPEARAEVVARAKDGEKMTVKKVKEVVQRGKPKKPQTNESKTEEERTVKPHQWSAEAVEVARVIAAALTRKPLKWIDKWADAIVGSYSVQYNESVDKFEALYRPDDTSKAGDRDTFIVGTGGSFEEVKRLAEDHWNNLETIASGAPALNPTRSRRP